MVSTGLTRARLSLASIPSTEGQEAWVPKGADTKSAGTEERARLVVFEFRKPVGYGSQPPVLSVAPAAKGISALKPGPGGDIPVICQLAVEQEPYE